MFPAGAVIREKTLVLSLDKSEDKLLADMQSRTRGYIRNIAGTVRISLARTDEDREQFLSNLLVLRQIARPHAPRRNEEDLKFSWPGRTMEICSTQRHSSPLGKAGYTGIATAWRRRKAR